MATAVEPNMETPPERAASCQHQSPGVSCSRDSLSPSKSPEPNCPICLEQCNSKCQPDRCQHQFCFKCLLEWSKVKVECPLCKQPFKTIKHFISSTNEYEVHHVQQTETNAQENLNILFEELDHPYLYLPNGEASRERQFQFRTTFTVDPRGELAIQQLLLTHFDSLSPQYLNDPYFNPNSTRFRRRYGSRRSSRFISGTHFRRAIYRHNWWVAPSPDVTGRYRECSPEFYRQNPAQRNRLVPWLNRELNAILHENTRAVMLLVDVILQNLLDHHILSRQFRNILLEHFQDKTDHFIHEFYSFMRSPYDMIGYDNNIQYNHHCPPVQPSTPIQISDDDEDSDALEILSHTLPPTPPPIDLVQPRFFRSSLNPNMVIEIESSDSDNSDVIIRTPTPPPIVDLRDLTDTDDENMSNSTRANCIKPTIADQIPYNSTATSGASNAPAQEDDVKRPVMLPLKMKLKRRRSSSSSSSSSSTSSSSSSSSSESSGRNQSNWKSSSSSTSSSCNSSSTATTSKSRIPITERVSKRFRKLNKKKRAYCKKYNITSNTAINGEYSGVNYEESDDRRSSSKSTCDDEPLSSLRDRLKHDSKPKHRKSHCKRSRHSSEEKPLHHYVTSSNQANLSSASYSSSSSPSSSLTRYHQSHKSSATSSSPTYQYQSSASNHYHSNNHHSNNHHYHHNNHHRHVSNHHRSRSTTSSSSKSRRNPTNYYPVEDGSNQYGQYHDNYAAGPSNYVSQGRLRSVIFKKGNSSNNLMYSKTAATPDRSNSDDQDSD